MKNPMRFLQPLAMGGALLAGLLFSAPIQSARAQSAPTDARWDAFLGCWQPNDATTAGTSALMCVVPSQGASAADIVTISGGKEVAREHVDANGQRIAATRDGCKGWDAATWARDDERVFIHSAYTCADGRLQQSTGILALNSDGELLDVQGLKSGAHTGVRVLRYREAVNPGTLPGDVSAALGNRTMAVDAARVAASAPVNTDDIIEASSRVSAPVVEAWLANSGQQQTVDAKQLERMANAGVPDSVINMVVALSYPQRFAVTGGYGGAAGTYGNGVAATRLAGVADTSAAARPCTYSMYGWGYNPCGFSPWGYGYSAYYGPYGPYSPYWDSWYGAYGPAYGYGYGYGYGGYGYGGWGGWYGGTPVIVVRSNTTPASHGRMVNGRGYVYTGGNGSTGTAVPRGTYRGGSSAGAGASASRGSSGGGGGGAVRTAHRVGGGGGK